MRFVRKLLGFGLLAASIVIVRGRRRAQRAARGVDVRPAAPADEEVSFDDTIGTSIPKHENLVDASVIELRDRLPR